MGVQWAEKQLGPLRDQLGWREQAAEARYSKGGERDFGEIGSAPVWQIALRHLAHETCPVKALILFLNAFGFSPVGIDAVTIKIKLNRRMSQKTGSEHMKDIHFLWQTNLLTICHTALSIHVIFVRYIWWMIVFLIHSLQFTRLARLLSSMTHSAIRTLMLLRRTLKI